MVSGRLGPTAAEPDSAAFSSASYAARDPCRDVRILHADCFGLLAAVLTFGPEAQPNGRYLQRNLQHEVLEQAAGTGDAAAAVPAAIAALNSAYRNLHPFNGPVLEGVLVAVAYVDLREQTLHMCATPPSFPSPGCGAQPMSLQICKLAGIVQDVQFCCVAS